MIYDAHCHMDLMNDMLKFINEVQDSDVRIFAVGTTPMAYNKEIQFCKNIQNIYVGLGLHPQLVSSGYDDMNLFETLIRDSHYIGEVGLDFSKEYIHTKKIQIKIFSEIIKLCEYYGEKVISIHSLKSVSTVIEILQTYKNQMRNKYILHWYTGSISELKKAIELGCYFSINPKMLKTKHGLEIIKNLPVNRMLLETDAPFACNMQNVNEIEEKLKKSISLLSDIVGFDVFDIINENSKNVFCY